MANDKLNKLIIQYNERFNDVVPVKELGTITDEELIDTLEKALSKNEPIEIEYLENAEY